MLPDPAQPPVIIEAYAPTHMRLRTDAATPTMLVLSETWHPGWRATVNSAPQPVELVNDFQRGVLVPAGAAAVDLTFAPDSLRRGWMLGALGLALGALLSAIGGGKGIVQELAE